MCDLSDTTRQFRKGGREVSRDTNPNRARSRLTNQQTHCLEEASHQMTLGGGKSPEAAVQSAHSSHCLSEIKQSVLRTIIQRRLRLLQQTLVRNADSSSPMTSVRAEGRHKNTYRVAQTSLNAESSKLWPLTLTRLQTGRGTKKTITAVFVWFQFRVLNCIRSSWPRLVHPRFINSAQNCDILPRSIRGFF